MYLKNYASKNLFWQSLLDAYFKDYSCYFLHVYQDGCSCEVHLVLR